MGKAFLVLGGESTGTRALTRLCILNGCDGTDEHLQPWDEGLPTPDTHPRIVWRRSLPHGANDWRHFPDPRQLIRLLEAQGYEVTVLVTVRCWRAAAWSQLAIGHVRSEEEALANLRHAYLSVLPALSSSASQVHFVVHESLRDPHAQVALLRAIGLDTGGCVTAAYTDENAKHYVPSSPCAYSSSASRSNDVAPHSCTTPASSSGQ